jgi:hypothetical protein
LRHSAQRPRTFGSCSEPGPLSAEEIEWLSREYWRQAGDIGFRVFTGPANITDERRALDRLRHSLAHHWAKARDAEGRILRELGIFPDPDASGISELHCEHDDADYVLRREAAGYSLHREIRPDEPLQPIAKADEKWPMGRTTGDGRQSSYGEHTTALRALNEAHAAHWKR